jgi:hypothetical protein
VLLPQAGLGEGAVKRLDCDLIQTCNAAGSCQRSEAESVSFRMEPLELATGGGGQYRIAYGDTEADMLAMSDTGPFLWNNETERPALLVSSEQEWLWHRLTVAPEPGAMVSFLRCSFQQ